MWLNQRNEALGSRFWALRYLLVGTSFVLILYRGSFPDGFNNTVPSIIVMWAAVEQIRGILEYREIKRSPLPLYALILAYGVGLLFVIERPAILRSAGTAVLSALLYIYAGYLLIRPPSREAHRVNTIVAGIFFLTALLHVSRILVNFVWITRSEVTSSLMIQPYYSLVYLVIAIMTGFGLLILVHEKLVSTSMRLLKEKQLLYKEMNHRIKNNLQVISSILRLQSSLSEEAEIQSHLRSAESRIHTMALIHEMLYRNEEKGEIPLSDYMSELIRDIIDSIQGTRTHLVVTTDIPDIRLGLDTVVSLGMVIHEVVMNAAKYAFPSRSEGHIYVAMETRNGDYCLTIVDDGIGVEDLVVLGSADTLGTSIIHSFAQKIGGTVTFQSDHGLTCTIRFPVSPPVQVTR